MKKLLDYELFTEALLGQIATGNFSEHPLFKNIKTPEEKLLKYKIINMGKDKEDIKLNFFWNNKPGHYIEEKLRSRTSLSSISQLNELLRYGLEELHEYYPNGIDPSARYSLWFSEYDFSVIVQISYHKKMITIFTILPGKQLPNPHLNYKKSKYDIIGTVELKSKLIWGTK